MLAKSHPSDDTLLRHIDGELATVRRATTDAHLATCPACHARRIRLQSAASAFDARPDDHVPLEAARMQLGARMADLAADWDRSTWSRVRNQFTMLPRSAAIGAAVVVLAFAAWWLRPQPESQVELQAGALESAVLPIPTVTPGAVRPISREEICDGDSPPTEIIPAAVRLAVLRDYRMVGVPADEYKLDYLITPALGGTAERENIWPERYGSRVWNARVKDRLERLLPGMVCQGTIDLTTAQHAIAADWIAAYKKYFHSDVPIESSASRRNHHDDDDARTPHVLLTSARLFVR